MTKQIRKNVKRERGQIILSSAMSKRLFQALHTVTLYLHQPAHVRQNQIDRIIDVRDTLEAEYKEQTGKTFEP
ncbi:hypothetical protein [Runella sp.]|uniref:hypothetical protein n=1 Tax=Runella sp. TaxID=1960881 RepID=UPI003D13E819